MRRLLPILLLLAVGACHPHKAPNDAPTPLAGIGPKPAYGVSQGAVDRAVPTGIDGYVAWKIGWAGSMPVTVVLERYVRGRCFARGVYTNDDKGDYALTKIPAKASKGGGPVHKGLVLLADVLDGPAGRGQGQFERDPIGRISWVYQLKKPTRTGEPPVEVVTRFHYEAHNCVLPGILDRGQIPAKVRPAGTGSPTPGSGG